MCLRDKRKISNVCMRQAILFRWWQGTSFYQNNLSVCVLKSHLVHILHSPACSKKRVSSRLKINQYTFSINHSITSINKIISIPSFVFFCLHSLVESLCLMTFPFFKMSMFAIFNNHFSIFHNIFFLLSYHNLANVVNR